MEATNTAVETTTATTEMAPATAPAKKSRKAAAKKPANKKASQKAAKAPAAAKANKAGKKAATKKAPAKEMDPTERRERDSAKALGLTLSHYRIAKFIGRGRRTYAEISESTGIDVNSLPRLMWGGGKDGSGCNPSAMYPAGLVKRVEDSERGICWELTAKGLKLMGK